MSSHSIDIQCVCDCEAQVTEATVTVFSERGYSEDFVITLPNTVRWQWPIIEVQVRLNLGGHWTMLYQKPGKWVRGPIPRLPPGPHGWWHTLHNGGLDGATAPLTIGVIDESLPQIDPAGPLRNVVHLGPIAMESAPHNRAYQSLGWDHGYIVCSLLGAQPVTPHSYVGIAPESKIYFAAAGKDSSPHLNHARVINALDILSYEQQCDIVTMSAGEVAEPLDQLHKAIDAAAQVGTLCFVAAGNAGGEPLYPAKYEECLSVGAVGKRFWAPERTLEKAQEASSPVVDDTLFLWYSSASGRYVDYLAAGALVCYSQRNGEVAAVTGTSYATPIAAGAAARVLAADPVYGAMPRNIQRVKYALKLLRETAFNPFHLHCNYGIIRGS